MAPLLHHALLGVAVLALAAAALRLASPLAGGGLVRAITAAAFAASAAVAWALTLGLTGLGGSTAALVVAAVVTWAAALVLLPRPDIGLGAEFGVWWRRRPSGERALLGGLGGAALAWALWQLRHPAIGFDSMHYHLPEIVLWVQGGHPGAVESLLPGLPVGNYPLTNEVTVAWATAIARSYVPFLLWPWVALALTATAGWAGLRALHVPPWPRALAVAALCSSPWLLAWQQNGSMTDPPALAWLVTCAALCALARDRPVLLAPAVVAAGLAIGVKTTTVPLGLVVLAFGVYAVRSRVHTQRVPLAAALVGAIAVGGVWYLRNLFDHGSPFWPFVAMPWGDPVPHAVRLVHTSFVNRPAETIHRLGHSYLSRFGGGLVLLAGGVLAPIAAPRSRRVLAAAVITGVAAIVWARSPVTGVPHAPGLDETIFSTTRYLLPVLAAACVALALAAGERTRLSILALLALSAAIVLNLVQTFNLGFPVAPPAWVPLAGLAAGAAAGALATRLAVPRPTLAAALLAACALLAIPAKGFVRRSADSSALFTSGAAKFLSANADYRAYADPVATTPAFIGVLAGDRLSHRLEAIPGGESCVQIVLRAHTQWLVAFGGRLSDVVPMPVARCLPGIQPALRSSTFTIYAPLIRTAAPGPSARGRSVHHTSPHAAQLPSAPGRDRSRSARPARVLRARPRAPRAHGGRLAVLPRRGQPAG